jgi:hypothetical protein
MRAIATVTAGLVLGGLAGAVATAQGATPATSTKYCRSQGGVLQVRTPRPARTHRR